MQGRNSSDTRASCSRLGFWEETIIPCHSDTVEAIYVDMTMAMAASEDVLVKKL